MQRGRVQSKMKWRRGLKPVLRVFFFAIQNWTKKSERSKSMEKAFLHFVPSSFKADDMLLTFLQQRKKCINFRLVSGHIICKGELKLDWIDRETTETFSYQY